MEYVVQYRANHSGLEYIIYREGDPPCYFLWVTNSDDPDIDELPGSSVEVCKAEALERYGVPHESWQAEESLT